MGLLLIRRRILQFLSREQHEAGLELQGTLEDAGRKTGRAAASLPLVTDDRVLPQILATLLGHKNAAPMGEHEGIYEMGSSITATMTTEHGTNMGQAVVRPLGGGATAATPGNGNVTHLGAEAIEAFSGRTAAETPGNGNVTHLGAERIAAFSGLTAAATPGNGNVTHLGTAAVAAFSGRTAAATPGNGNVTHLGAAAFTAARQETGLGLDTDGTAAFQPQPFLLRAENGLSADGAAALQPQPVPLQTVGLGLSPDGAGAAAHAGAVPLTPSDELEMETYKVPPWAEQEGSTLYVLRTWNAEQTGETLLLDSCEITASRAVVSGNSVTLYWQQSEDRVVGILWGDGTPEETAVTQESTSTGKPYAVLGHSYQSGSTHEIRLYLKNAKTGAWTPGNGDVAGKDCGFLGGYSISKKEDETTPELTAFSFGAGASLAQYSFYGCSGLTEADLAGQTAAPKYAFYGCTALTTLRNSEGLKTVGDHSFRNCDLTSLPPNLTTVGSNAFYGNRKLTGALPESLMDIGEYAFYACGFTEITVGIGVSSVGKNAFVNNPYLVHAEYAAANMPTGTFSGCTKLEKVWIRSSCWTIDAPDGTTTPYGAYNGKLSLCCEPASRLPGWSAWFNYAYETKSSGGESTLVPKQLDTTWSVTETPW